MPRIRIEDLKSDVILTKKEMEFVLGGTLNNAILAEQRNKLFNLTAGTGISASAGHISSVLNNALAHEGGIILQ